MKPIIKLSNVWKIYDMGKVKVEAVRGISFSISKGEFVVIMGPSGSGKSTLLNLIGCLDLPTRGKIYLKDKDISKLSESELASLRGKTIGFVFQSFNLLSSLTALENVELPMIFQDIPVSLRKKKAQKLLELVGLNHRAHHYPNELSGGEQQRVAIARALANDPEILIADEPTGNLDTKRGEEIIKLIKKLNEERNMTTIIVTHDPSIARFGDRVELIRDGKITETIKNVKNTSKSYFNKLIGGANNETKQSS